jgi:hypothetical protein
MSCKVNTMQILPLGLFWCQDKGVRALSTDQAPRALGTTSLTLVHALAASFQQLTALRWTLYE